MYLDQLVASAWVSFGIVGISLIIFVPFLIVLSLFAFLKDRISVRWIDRDVVNAAIWTALPLGIAGATAGYLTGLSRAPAMQALVPAVLTLVSGGALLAIGKTRDQAWGAGIAVMIFAVNILAGSSIGTTVRENSNARLMSVEYQQKLARDELRIREYRKNLDLPEKPLFTGITEERTSGRAE